MGMVLLKQQWFFQNDSITYLCGGIYAEFARLRGLSDWEQRISTMKSVAWKCCIEFRENYMQIKTKSQIRYHVTGMEAIVMHAVTPVFRSWYSILLIHFQTA